MIRLGVCMIVSGLVCAVPGIAHVVRHDLRNGNGGTVHRLRRSEVVAISLFLAGWAVIIGSPFVGGLAHN